MTDDFPAGLSLDQKIEVFADRVIGWQLDPGQEMADKIPGSGFAVLHIVMSYFESIAKFEAGYSKLGKSRKYFKLGFNSVFHLPQKIDKLEANSLIDLIYEQLRCGLYHSGMTGRGIVITGEISSVIQVGQSANGEHYIVVNPHKIAGYLKQHFLDYLRKLRNPEEDKLRLYFEKRFDWLESGQLEQSNNSEKLED